MGARVRLKQGGYDATSRPKNACALANIVSFGRSKVGTVCKQPYVVHCALPRYTGKHTWPMTEPRMQLDTHRTGDVIASK